MDSIKPWTIVLATFFLCLSCANKSKTDLYLERGLDVLNNVKEVNFEFIKGYSVKKIGVIRDEKLQTKTLVLILNEELKEDTVNKYSMGIRAEHTINDKKVVEQWDFKPKLIRVKDFNYLVTEIPFSDVNKIKRVHFYLYDRIKFNNEIGNRLELFNLYTNND